MMLFSACADSGNTRPSPLEVKEPPPHERVRHDPDTGAVTYLKGANLSALLDSDAHFAELKRSDSFAEIVFAFLDAHRQFFLLTAPSEEFSVTAVDTDDIGLTHVRLRQSYRDAAVVSSDFIVHLNRDNAVYLMQGSYLPTPTGVDMEEIVSVDVAWASVSGQDSNCERCAQRLVLWGRQNAELRLAHELEVWESQLDGWRYFVDAQSGDVLEKQPLVAN